MKVASKAFEKSSYDSDADCAANILRNLTCNNQYFKEDDTGASKPGVLKVYFKRLVDELDKLDSGDKLNFTRQKAQFYSLGEAILSTLKNLTSKSQAAKKGSLCSCEKVLTVFRSKNSSF